MGKLNENSVCKLLEISLLVDCDENPAYIMPAKFIVEVMPESVNQKFVHEDNSIITTSLHNAKEIFGVIKADKNIHLYEISTFKNIFDTFFAVSPGPVVPEPDKKKNLFTYKMELKFLTRHLHVRKADNEIIKEFAEKLEVQGNKDEAAFWRTVSK